MTIFIIGSAMTVTLGLMVFSLAKIWVSTSNNPDKW
ncbi:YnaM/YnfT family protein [Pseudocitrobacter corydidari]